MWPGFGDIVSLVKIVSLDFLERVNLINKNYEQERGEKSTFSRRYSSIGLYCAASANQHWYVYGDTCLSVDLLACSGLFKVITDLLFRFRLYCGAANPLVRSGYGFVCPSSGLILELLSCCCKGSIAADANPHWFVLLVLLRLMGWNYLAYLSF